VRKTSVVVAGARTCARGGRSNERDRYGRIDKVIDTSRFDTKIQELEKREAALRDQMEETCQEFLQVTSKFAIEWFQSRVQQEVTSRPKLAKQLGVERLRQIKSELKALVSEAPNIVNKHINSKKYWAHRGALPDKSGDHEVVWRYSILGRRGPDELEGAVSQLLGYAGAILVKHRIANTERRVDWHVNGGGGSRDTRTDTSGLTI